MIDPKCKLMENAGRIKKTFGTWGVKMPMLGWGEGDLFNVTFIPLGLRGQALSLVRGKGSISDTLPKMEYLKKLRTYLVKLQKY